MTTDHSPSLDEIREAAEKASGTEWDAAFDDRKNWHVSLSDGGHFLPGLIATVGYGEQAADDATYIAMMDPQTTLGLLTRLAVAEANVQAQSDAEQKQYDRAQRAEKLLRACCEYEGEPDCDPWPEVWDFLGTEAPARAFTEANPTPGADADVQA